MINTELLVSRPNVMLPLKINLAFVFLLLLGCSGRGHWVGAMNGFIGTKLESNIYSDCSRGCGNSYWSPYSNLGEEFDDVVSEGEGYRYYITWRFSCKYSIFVTADGVIRSWRYESEDRSSCVIW